MTSACGVNVTGPPYQSWRGAGRIEGGASAAIRSRHAPPAPHALTTSDQTTPGRKPLPPPKARTDGEVAEKCRNLRRVGLLGVEGR